MKAADLAASLGSFGPAWIVMMADVDAASIITAAETGVVYHYGLIWLLLLLIVPLFFIQEASGRIGAATGRGFGEVVRSRYSTRVALIAAVPMAVTDVVSYAVEYAGIAIGFAIFGVSPLVSLPLAYILHLLLIYRRKYRHAELVLLAISAVLVGAYALSLGMNGIQTNMSPFYVSTERKFLFLVAANAGAVVMPFMLFYQASATAEKRASSVRGSRISTLIGAVASEAVMVAIVMGTSTLDSFTNFASPSELSKALSALGSYSPYVFGSGLIAASLLALTVISLGSAWGLAEAIGWPRSKSFGIYLAESIPALAAVLASVSDLLSLALNLMIVLVFVLIGPAILMGAVSSSREIMGSYASGTSWKIGYWASVAGVISMGVVYALSLVW